MNTIINIFILLVFSFIVLNGQTDEWPEWKNHVNTHKVKSILVNGDFLWLATNGGMVKYSKNTGGKNFFNKGNSNIPDNFINDIAKDAKGNIWFTCHFYGIGMYNGKSFTNYNEENSSIPSIQWNVPIQTDSKGNKWFGSLRNVVKFDGNTWETWETGSPISSSNTIHDIFVDKNDDVWVAGEWGVGIIKDNEFSYFDQVTNDINCITSDNNDILWFGGKNNTFIKYTNNQFTNVTLTSTSSNNEIFSMVVDKNNVLWIGSSAGIIKYSEATDILYNSTNSNLPEDGILSISADDDVIWIGTFTNGLYKFTNDTFLKVQLGFNEMPDMGRLNDIECFNNSMYFVGMLDRILYLKDNKWNVIDSVDGLVDILNYSIKSNDDKLVLGSCCESSLSYIKNNLVTSDINFINSDKAILSILPIGSTSYWLGTSKGLIKYENGTITEYNIANSPLISNIIKDIVFDNEGNLWGVMTGGIFKYSNDNWTIYDTLNTDLLNYDITKIKVDSKNNIWFNALHDRLIGPYDGNGITKFDGSEWKNYNIYNSALPSNTVFDIYIDEEDNIWCGTFVGGLARFNQATWIIYNAYNSGIAHNDVSALEKTPDGKLWLGHWKGEVSVLNTYIVSSSDLDQGNEDNIMIYPNPTHGNFFIKFNKPLITPTVIKIFDLSGSEIAVKHIEVNSIDRIFNISLQDVGINKSGLYLIHVNTKNIFYNKNLVFLK